MGAHLPSSHAGANLTGWSFGRGATSNGVSSILSGVGGAQTGVSSGINPSTDGQRHHVVSSFDGGNRKALHRWDRSCIHHHLGKYFSASSKALVIGAVDKGSGPSPPSCTAMPNWTMCGSTISASPLRTPSTSITSAPEISPQSRRIFHPTHRQSTPPWEQRCPVQ